MNQRKESKDKSLNTKPMNEDSSGKCSIDSITSKTFTVPIRLRSEANIKDHWAKKRKRRLDQQKAVAILWNSHIRALTLPAGITLTRQAPRTLDDDNLVSAFKWIRDAIADLITPGLARGRADNVEGLSFHYSQEKCKTYGVKITVTPEAQ